MGMRITKEQARRFLIRYHDLDGDNLAGKNGILEYMKRVRCIQFDPLNVVGHNQDLVLQARVKDYSPHLLRELLYTDYRLVDLWDKNMSICITEDWPLFSRFRRGYLNWCSQHPEITQAIREKITNDGACSSSSFDFEEKVGWHYGETRLARAALEGMYYSGQLVIHHKTHTRKYYDLSERHISEDLLNHSDPNVTDEQFLDWYVLRRIACVGFLWNRPSDAWLGIRPSLGYSLRSKERNEAFSRLLAENKITEIRIDELQYPVYIRTEDLNLMKTILDETDQVMTARIIAPLDNMLWDRNLIKELFDFDYRWEVYKPAAERQYGYYVLPVLYGDRFVARFEPEKYHPNTGSVIKNWWWEENTTRTSEMESAIQLAMEQFVGYLNLKINGASNLPKEKTVHRCRSTQGRSLLK